MTLLKNKFRWIYWGFLWRRKLINSNYPRNYIQDISAETCLSLPEPGEDHPPPPLDPGYPSEPVVLYCRSPISWTTNHNISVWTCTYNQLEQKLKKWMYLGTNFFLKSKKPMFQRRTRDPTTLCSSIIDPSEFIHQRNNNNDYVLHCLPENRYRFCISRR